MRTSTDTDQNVTYTIGWITLLVISMLATLNHLMLPLYGDDIALSIGWTAFSLYATVVLAIPFRRGERWAWYTSWLLVIGFAFPILIVQETYTMMYLVAAGIMALDLIMIRSVFFRTGQTAT